MPLVGLGTLHATDDETTAAVEAAIDMGYRHIDTAYLYFNEAGVGRGIRNKIAQGVIKREDIFLTTKLPHTHLTPERVHVALEKSLARLDIGYIDLYLMHSPLGFLPTEDETNLYPTDAQGNHLIHDVDHKAVWREMEKAVESGKVRSIGVSNFNRRQIQFILDNSTIKPANLQIECHIYYQQKELVNYCHSKGISVSGYGPLGNPGLMAKLKAAGKQVTNVLDEPTLQPLMKKYNKSAAQILLRWEIQRDIIVIPKSTNPKRMQENLDIFDFKLTAEEMDNIAKLDQKLRVYALPFSKNVLESKDFPWGPNDPY
ncbi:1,5-anhydro-D-fructose reductase-like [Paramacrobiotus metropolitanus]|uniref:1,5-anhydro-D-fructose reductase-like n=1 Tax=Paramacrobiotus metropolitanus TaxID=2943436 RepID=UPI0024459748|nr:1,5-anhydro-D-fructose reductase-like [Paramacrobiotus metropolitanus]